MTEGMREQIRNDYLALSVILTEEHSEEDFVCECGSDDWVGEHYDYDNKTLINYECRDCGRDYCLRIVR